MSTSKLLSIALASVIALSVSPLARAEGSGAAQSRVVRYSELEFSSPAGVKAVYQRIRSAARSVCGSPDVPGSALKSVVWENCVRTTIRDAIAKADRPALTAYYAERIVHQPLPTIAARTD